MWLEPEPAREGRRSYGVVWFPTLSMLLSRRFDFVGMWRSGMWVACSAKSASEGRWASRGPGHPGAMLTAPAATYLRRSPYRSYTKNPHLFLANQNHVNHPTRRSTSDTEAIALPERPARGKRNFQVPGSDPEFRIDAACGVCRSGPGAPCLPRGGVVGPVFNGRVGNGVPAVRVAVSGYYEKLEIIRRRVYAVGYPG